MSYGLGKSPRDDLECGWKGYGPDATMCSVCVHTLLEWEEGRGVVFPNWFSRFTVGPGQLLLNTD